MTATVSDCPSIGTSNCNFGARGYLRLFYMVILWSFHVNKPNTRATIPVAYHVPFSTSCVLAELPDQPDDTCARVCRTKSMRLADRPEQTQCDSSATTQPFQALPPLQARQSHACLLGSVRSAGWLPAQPDSPRPGFVRIFVRVLECAEATSVRCPWSSTPLASTGPMEVSGNRDRK